jgi:hypothetical protein
MYPAGWDILEPTVVTLPGFVEPQVMIVMANFTFEKPVGGGEIPAGGLKLDLYNSQLPLPSGGASIVVGPQHISARQVIVTHDTSPQLATNLEKVVSIYFTAGKRDWVLNAYFAKPTDVADQNGAILDKIVGSLRYDR